uniref:Uncharacterized protein n=1 Tax=Arundo donax TaxID=35708 RepID=A0A0A8Y9H8_ARUDO
MVAFYFFIWLATESSQSFLINIILILI